MPGVIESYVHTGNQIGALVELNCQSQRLLRRETTEPALTVGKIIAKTSELKTLAKEIAMQIVASPKVQYIKNVWRSLYKSCDRCRRRNIAIEARDLTLTEESHLKT